MNLLLSNVYTVLVKVTIKIILIFLSNFFFLLKRKRRMRALKIQGKHLLNMKIVVNYWNFAFQFIKNTKLHFGQTDSIP